MHGRIETDVAVSTRAGETCSIMVIEYPPADPDPDALNGEPAILVKYSRSRVDGVYRDRSFAIVADVQQ